MAWIGLFCLLLVVLTTVIHYEALRLLSERLPQWRFPTRPKVLVVFFNIFLAHSVEIILYGLMSFLLVRYSHLGTLNGGEPSLFKFIYFSAETYSSLGYGDLIPTGPLRLFAGVESLNGLLLIGWSASYIHIVMERFWNDPPP